MTMVRMLRAITVPMFFLIVLWRVGTCAALELSHDWGGHVKIQGSFIDDDDTSLFTFFGDERRLDSALDLRLTDKIELDERIEFDIHYQLGWTGGETYQAVWKLKDNIPVLLSSLIPGFGPSDRRRLFDLSSTVHEDGHDLAWHRLDRLSLALKQQGFQMRIGRQALTWGNGLVFNPMDLVNPFAPTDTVRDYKTGDDMVLLAVEPDTGWNVQAALVPRRNPVSGDVENDSSTFAVKGHAMIGGGEADLMAARHAGENMMGLGYSHNAGQALFRFDLLYSTLNQGRGSDKGYAALVANLDRSWAFLDRNVYGLLEYHHNGLGHQRVNHALFDPDLVERIDRGEMTFLGRNYLGAQLRIELHPLVQFAFNLIESLDRFTGIVQPRFLVDLSQNSNLQVGGTFFHGEKGTEFGGIPIPGTRFTLGQGDSVYLIAGYYF